MRPYKKILAVSVFISAFLYWYDHKTAGAQQLTAKQQAMEIIIWGSVSTISIFLTASLLYLLATAVIKLLKGAAKGNHENNA